VTFEDVASYGALLLTGDNCTPGIARCQTRPILTCQAPPMIADAETLRPGLFMGRYPHARLARYRGKESFNILLWSFSRFPTPRPPPQDVAVGAFLLTPPKILWYARFTEAGAGDHM
jgi:hypothetical protein